jgi:hypothetical protein
LNSAAHRRRLRRKAPAPTAMMTTATAATMTVEERPPEGEEAVELFVLDCVDKLVMVELVDVVGANTWKHSSAAVVELEARKSVVSGV